MDRPYSRRRLSRLSFPPEKHQAVPDEHQTRQRDKNAEGGDLDPGTKIRGDSPKSHRSNLGRPVEGNAKRSADQESSYCPGYGAPPSVARPSVADNLVHQEKDPSRSCKYWTGGTQRLLPRIPLIDGHNVDPDAWQGRRVDEAQCKPSPHAHLPPHMPRVMLPVPVGPANQADAHDHECGGYHPPCPKKELKWDGNQCSCQKECPPESVQCDAQGDSEVVPTAIRTRLTHCVPPSPES
jgi:hypothetical protein